jgi:hypothetical protein
MASFTVGNGEEPVSRKLNSTPIVHTSAGGAWYGFFRRISDDA